MDGPTLHFEAELTNDDMVILDNLMLEQENGRVARGLRNTSTNIMEENCVIMLTQPSRNSRSVAKREMLSILAQVDTMASATKTLRAIMES